MDMEREDSNMAHYIDADKLKAEIGNRYDNMLNRAKLDSENANYWNGKADAYRAIYDHIDSLQQEQSQVADASNMEQSGVPVDGEVHHVLNCHYISTDNTQLCERLREFPEGAKVDIFIFAKEEQK